MNPPSPAPYLTFLPSLPLSPLPPTQSLYHRHLRLCRSLPISQSLSQHSNTSSTSPKTTTPPPLSSATTTTASAFVLSISSTFHRIPLLPLPMPFFPSPLPSQSRPLLLQSLRYTNTLKPSQQLFNQPRQVNRRTTQASLRLPPFIPSFLSQTKEAFAYRYEEQPLCISGDGGVGIYIWGITDPFGQEPIKKLFEQKDWRYTGIHALAISGTGYLFTGSGDKSIKAWSLQDYSLSCIMNGHKSVVSTLAVLLGEDAPGNVTFVLSLATYGDALVVAHENGCMKRNVVLLKSKQVHNGAIFSELLGDEFGIDATSLGSIALDLLT
ncbi:hypothetical protein LOK49_Contig79G00001, partial [Camellia lanceoleosa]